jgi:hypothetical protein
MYYYLEALTEERINRRLEAKEFRLAHRARADSKPRRTNSREDGSKKFRLLVVRLSPPRSTCDSPSIRLQRSAS